MSKKLNDVSAVYEGMLLGYIDDLGALQLMKDAIELRIEEIESTLPCRYYRLCCNCDNCKEWREMADYWYE